MIECLLSWVFLIDGIVSGEALSFLTAGAFAIAAQIGRIADRMKRL